MHALRQAAAPTSCRCWPTHGILCLHMTCNLATLLQPCRAAADWACLMGSGGSIKACLLLVLPLMYKALPPTSRLGSMLHAA